MLIGILIDNQRLNDVARAVDVRFADANRHIDDVNEMLRADLLRMEQVIDARVKHLEER